MATIELIQDRPDRETFTRLAEDAAHSGAFLVPLHRRLLSDTLSPVLAYRRLVEPDDRLAPSFLLESVEGGQRVGRYSYLGHRPRAALTARGNDVTWQPPEPDAEPHHYQSPDPLAEMARLSASFVPAPSPDLPAFSGGWLGYAAYDSVRYAEGEKLPDPPPDDRGLPDLHFQLFLDLVVFDHVQKTLLAITHVDLRQHGSVDAAYTAGQRALDELVGRIETPRQHTGAELPVGQVDLHSPPPTLPASRMGLGGYQQAVRKAKEYIAAGDIFQVVPSQRFELHTEADPFDVYRALRVINPSPYMFYLQIPGGMLVGSSPEILCRVQDGVVTSRPLAGTRRRGMDEAEDASLADELLADPKEVSEHVMLVDLARNDVGKVARPRSVTLPTVMAVERYSHVMHISSTVLGELRAGLSCWDALRAVLPVGTVSGAPKVRAMQIIDELEPVKRGPYAGAVGYVDLRGHMDVAIALRTMVIQPGDAAGTWRVHVQAGAGIVAESDPDSEHQETVNKAAALAKSVQAAERMFVARRPIPGNGSAASHESKA